MRECLIRQIPLRLATTLSCPALSGRAWIGRSWRLDGCTASDPTLATDADRRNSTCLVPCSWNHAEARQCGGSRLREIVYPLPARELRAKEPHGSILVCQVVRPLKRRSRCLLL